MFFDDDVCDTTLTSPLSKMNESKSKSKSAEAFLFIAPDIMVSKYPIKKQ